MDGVKILLIIGIFSFFLVGCCSLSGDSSFTTNNPSSGPNTGPNQQSNQNGGNQPSQNDLSGQTYAALVALGVPLECDITSTYEGTSTTMKVYMKGSVESRTEIDTTGSTTCDKMIAIVKGDTVYTGCETGYIFSDCKWYSMTVNSSDSSSDYGSSGAQPDFSNVPTSQIDCKPWNYDASKFTPTGKVCSLEDLMSGYQQ